MRSFGSDNHSGVHPAVLEAIAKANVDHVPAYGYDPITAEAETLFRRELGENVAVFFVLTGTGANVLGLKALTQSYEAVICARESHMNVDECGAPERLACKLITVLARGGKLHPEDLGGCFAEGEHHVRSRVISISQTTEWGTAYTPAEISALAAFAHKHNCYLHVDGARISNAAAALGVTFKQMTADAGVDVLSFGGTKNGLMCGEAVVFFDKGLAKDFKYIRKQGMQLASKMRFVSAQFIALLSNELWKKNAAHANAMARLLADSLRGNPKVKIVQLPDANAVFAQLPPEAIAKVREHFFFYVWDERESIARWMTAWDTTPEEVRQFASLVDKATGS